MKIIDHKTAISLGLKRYYTGKVCRRGHVAERYTAGACVACVSQLKQQYYQENKEKILAYVKVQGKLYRQANPEKRAANSRKWKLNNKEKIHQFEKARRKMAPEKFRAAVRKSYYKHRDKSLLKNKNWRDKNKGRVNYHTSKRKADMLLRTPKWVGTEEKWLIEQAYELAAMRTKMFGFSWHVDHIIPMRGKYVSGLHVPTNLQVIPGIENIRKKNKFEVKNAEPV